MPRLSRAESQARTREQLLVTATQLFLRDGYFATSLEKVADEAGFSKGAVYSNFGGKDELCLAVLDGIHADQALQIGAALNTKGGLDRRLAALRRWAERTLGDEGWSSLEIEFASQARRDPGLRGELARRSVAIRALIATMIEAHAHDFGIELPLPAADLATALLSLGVGLGLQRALDPTIPARVFTDVVRALAAPR
jgi:AcrR family transcriptional regulator